MDRPIPELAPVTIAFWPLSNLRFSIFGTTGFGKSIKLFSAYGTLGLGRLAASGGMVGMLFLFLFCGFVARSRDSLQTLQPGGVVVAGGADPGGPGPCHAIDEPASPPPATAAALRFGLAMANHLRRRQNHVAPDCYERSSTFRYSFQKIAAHDRRTPSARWNLLGLMLS